MFNLLAEVAAQTVEYGQALAIIGIARCVGLCGIGSGLGLYKTSSAAAGVLGENPKKFGSVVVLVLLPATQGIYGFIIAIIASSSATAGIAIETGWQIFAACLPMAISGFFSGLLQGKSSASCIYAVGKQEGLAKLIMFPGMIEFYAILGLIISIMLL